MSIRKSGQVIAGTLNITGVLSDVADLKQTTLRTDQITNCITEIPQDIKLELSNGTLTLKAGSKVYVPNGAGVFEVKTISSDLTLTAGWGNQQFFVYIDEGDLIAMRESVFTESGSSSSLTTQYRCWYDTTNNSIKWTDDYGSNWRGGFSLPIALVTADASSIISIDQIFNGFGYIGSTVFALPGVKGLIPNGRNDDGSLRSIEFVTSKVLTKTRNISGSGLLAMTATDFANYAVINYDEQSNYNLTSDGNILNRCVVGTWSANSSGVITSLSPKLPFRAADYQDMQLKQDKATAVNHDNITNCITEIPQDIKLELNNGVLTLKAGSKVYNGNGLLLTKTSDSTSLNANYNGQVMLFVSANGDNILTAFNGGTVSTLPTLETSYKAYYNTSDGKCYIDAGYWIETSLPIAIGTSTTESWVSIDQVFNGFGYIGSTIFALPGVKGLIPNGRNADGTLKNIEFTTSKVLAQTTSDTNNFVMILSAAGVIGSSVLQYIEKDNLNINGANGSILNFAVAGTFIRTAGVVSNFRPKQPFQAVDRNDISWVFKNIPVIDVPSTSSGVRLADNTVYKGTMTGAMTFVLPTVTDKTTYHQIKAMLYLPVVTINWGTTHYIGGDAPDVSEAGQYMIYWDYVPNLNAWAVGAMKVV